MFSDKELIPFKSDYFSDFSYSNGTVQIRSKNTGHWWMFKYVYFPIRRMIRLYHKYPDSTKYHIQCHVSYPWKVLKEIQYHDRYIIKKSYNEVCPL